MKIFEVINNLLSYKYMEIENSLVIHIKRGLRGSELLNETKNGLKIKSLETSGYCSARLSEEIGFNKAVSEIMNIIKSERYYNEALKSIFLDRTTAFNGAEFVNSVNQQFINDFLHQVIVSKYANMLSSKQILSLKKHSVTLVKFYNIDLGVCENANIKRV